jgi:phosphatidylglycerophosphate synthase
VLTRRRIPDGFSLLRLLLIPVLWGLALTGQGRAVGIGLIVAGASDFLDGYLARRFGLTSPNGARLDSLADNLLLVSALAWIALLRPVILRDQPGLLAITATIYLSSQGVGLIKFHQLGNLHLYSSKVAGALLYTFALITLISGLYEPPLLLVAALAFIVSSSETLAAQLLLPSVDENLGSLVRVLRKRKETTAIQPSGRARNVRSQSPHSEKSVASSASPTTSVATAAAPQTKDSRA